MVKMLFTIILQHANFFLKMEPVVFLMCLGRNAWKKVR